MLALLHGMALAAIPSSPLIAVGVWWNSNTIAHNFIHRPFFRSRCANVVFGAYLSVLLGIPQSWWRARHLAHHGISDRRGISLPELALQTLLVAGWWAVLLVYARSFFVAVYMPGYAAGLALCALHGYYEHARGTISHYGVLYNTICFNDGYHVEHHRHPGVDWRRLPSYRDRSLPSGSAWPAPLRWLEAISLVTLERAVLEVSLLQRFMLHTHRDAFKAFGGVLASAQRIAIVGGGLFPRTALVLRSLWPGAELIVIDANREHLECARRILDDSRVTYVNARYEYATNVYSEDADRPERGCDVLIIPLGYDGDRNALYANPPVATLIVHDWIWRKRGASRIVSPWLLKRLNVIAR